jgi:hypothetical protein
LFFTHDPNFSQILQGRLRITSVKVGEDIKYKQSQKYFPNKKQPGYSSDEGNSYFTTTGFEYLFKITPAKNV